MKKTFFPNKIIQIILLFFAAILVIIPVMFIVGIKSFTTKDSIQTFVFALVCIVFIGITYLINFQRKQKLDLNFNLISFRLIGLTTILLFIFSLGINTPINIIINQILHNKINLSNPFTRPYYVVGAVLLGPILEEIIFRSIILRGLLTRYSPKFAIVFSAIIFGLIHGRTLQIWVTFIIGLILGYVYYKTKSIGTTVLLHSFVNLIVLIKSYLLFKYVDMTFSFSEYIFLVIVSIPLTIIITRKLILKQEHENINIK